ncbi:hypothetical protein ACCS66_37070, partial [Rhizobium ruizarguesonis]
HLKYAWLDVMASASTAIDTYRRWGFVDIGTKLFPRPVRKGFHDMVVFRKTFPPPKITGHTLRQLLGAFLPSMS